MCIQRRCQLANMSRSRSRNLIPAAAFVRDSHSLLHFFALAQRVSHSEGNTPAGEARRERERERERANAFPYSYRPLSPTMLRDKYHRGTN